METEFIRLIRPIVKTENYRKMKNFKHHHTTSTYSHSLKVAYIAYLYVKKHNSKVDINALIRGALLHDYYLYDWHTKDKSHRLHGYRHPKFSYQNALKDYPNISKKERDIILHHMFPLTLNPPHSKEAWIVCLCDKKATLADYFKHKKRKSKKENL